MVSGFMFFLNAVGIPGSWVTQLLFLGGVSIAGRFLFKEKDIRGTIFWGGMGILSGLTVLRWLL